MCEYCKEDEEKVILEFEYDSINRTIRGYQDKYTEKDIEENKRMVKIDRGHLRLYDPDDGGCLDHGEKIQIKYCPFCGNKIKQLWEQYPNII